MTDHRWLVLALMVAGPAVAGEWCSVAPGDFAFEARFEGDRLPGEFREFEVEFRFDPNRPEAASLFVTVDLTAADLGDPEMNAVLFAPEWFDTERFGMATFTSTTVEQSEEGNFAAHGMLSLKGRDGEVTVPFRWQPAGDHARMEGTFELRRTRFDVGTGEWADGDAIGLDVTLNFSFELEHCD